MARMRLLVVDNEPQVSELLSKAFATQFDVLTATSGEEAIKKAVIDQPSCILMDVQMPQMGGFLLCEILKMIKQTQWIPILVVSRTPRNEVWSTVKEMGILDYIEKPFSIERVSEAINRVLQSAPAERRRTPRVKMNIPIIVRGKDVNNREIEVSSNIEDVSRLGALVSLTARIPVGQEIEIWRRDLTAPNRQSLITKARVVWNDDEGGSGTYWHGVEILNPSSQWVIQQYVH